MNRTCVCLMIVLLWTALVGSFGCKRQEKSEVPAEYVSEVTKLVKPDGEITVRFVRDEARSGQINQTLKAKVFEITPAVEGQALWLDARTLAFKPNRPLSAGTTYTVAVNLQRLFPARKDAGMFSFKVEVPSLELVEVSAEFVPIGNDPSKVDLKGSIKFNQRVDPKKVQGAISVREGDKEQKLAWREEGMTHQFVLANLVRGNTTRHFVVSVDGSKLGVVQSREDTFDLPMLQDFVIESVSAVPQGEQQIIQINLSDPLVDQQDLAGFITVDPPQKLNITYSGKKILLSGSFELGKTYTVNVLPGIKSRWQTVTKEKTSHQVTIANQKPALEFSQAGVFLPSAAKQRIAFKSINVKKVHIVVSQVFENNLGHFLQESSLRTGKKDHENDHDLSRVGMELMNQDLEYAPPRNQWVQNEIDLGPAMAKAKKGLLVVKLSIVQNGTLFTCKEHKGQEQGRVPFSESAGAWFWEGGDSYYDNPCYDGFYYSSQINKPIIFTDIGLTAKQETKQTVLFATDINTTEPLAGVKVTAFTYQNQVINTGTTNAEGMVRIDIPEDQSVFFYQAEWRGQRSALKPNEMSLDLSTFDVGGTVDPNPGIRTYTYLERGVFRPGDPIHLTAVLRHPNDSFPKDLPVDLRLYDPKGHLHRSLTQKTGEDGVYVFTIETKESDYTGTWQARILVGSKEAASTPIKIETVVPNRLKVTIKPEKAELGPNDRNLNLDLSSIYLFGAPASGLQAQVSTTIVHRTKSFQKFPDFTFNATAIPFKPIVSDIFDEALDEKGRAKVSWELPDFSHAPSALDLRLLAKVFEKGGRFTAKALTIPIEPWKIYVGARFPTEEGVKVDEPSNIQVIALDQNGTPVAGRKLNLRVYTNRHYWWWQYSHEEDYQSRYKSDKETILLHQASLISADKPVVATFTAKEYGELLIEVQDGDNGHTTSTFMWTYGWTRSDQEKSAAVLAPSADKKTYKPGETATIKFQTPRIGRALITVEKMGQVLSHRWVSVTTEQTAIKVPITENMIPNAYVFVSFLQPHAQTKNDRPMRLYGVVPISVENPSSRLALEMAVADELKPQEPFKVKITSKDDRAAQITVAVVDEGLLDLTSFATPNPWDFFYAKRPIGVATSDLFDQVIGAVWGDIFQRFTVGGAEGADRKQLIPVKVQRFKPVSLFKGPISIPARGQIEVAFDMPNYNGSVRIMVVGVSGNAYASLEQTRPVRKPLIVFASLPRVLGPKDSCELPVTIFGLKDDVGQVEVSVKTQGPVELVGSAKQTITFKAVGEKDVNFKLKAKAEVGAAKVAIVAKSDKYESTDETELAVRPSSPAITIHEDKVLEPNQPWNVTLKPQGLSGTQKVRAVISNVPNMNFAHRFDWLIHYPYGCAEQITSGAFPQLNVRRLFPNLLRADQVDRNINAAIELLAQHQLSNGGFRYWIPDTERHNWLTNYAGHFLVAAQKKGYYVPPEVLERWINFQRRQASAMEPTLNHAYRLYTLALAGKADLGAMNVLRENKLAELSNPARLLLAGAYQLAGAADVARTILSKIDQAVADTQSFDDTFGSELRDDAIALELFSQLGDKERAFKAYERISRKLAGWDWYSTQSLAWALLAAGDYVLGTGLGPVNMTVSIELSEQPTINIQTTDYAETVDLTAQVGKRIVITSKSAKPIYASIVQDLVPIEPPAEQVSDNLGVKAEFFNEDGAAIDVSSIPQGTSFWMVFRVTSNSDLHINQVALAQVLPAGWEIENTRLTNELLPNWLASNTWRFGSESYVDIRDDRIIWFFDLWGIRHHYWYSYKDNEGQVFAVKLNAVTQGEYLLPPTYAEAMYNADFRARLSGKWVKVVAPKKTP